MQKRSNRSLFGVNQKTASEKGGFDHDEYSTKKDQEKECVEDRIMEHCIMDQKRSRDRK